MSNVIDAFIKLYLPTSSKEKKIGNVAKNMYFKPRVDNLIDTFANLYQILLEKELPMFTTSLYLSDVSTKLFLLLVCKMNDKMKIQIKYLSLLAA